MIRTKIQRSASDKTLILLLVALLAAGVLLAAKPAHANAFTVTSTDDSGPGSLRQAIIAANARSGADTIGFGIPGGGVKTIRPSEALPDITGQVTINGYTQPGSRPNSLPTGGTDAVIMVEISGSNAGPSASGLRVKASKVVVRGLAINLFGDAGIEVSTGADGVRIEGNFIGTDATGTLDRGNTSDGVSFKTDFAGDGAGGDSVVGGSSAAKRNLISGNNRSAVTLNGEGGNTVQGNLIGVQKDGTSSLGGSREGVLVASPKNTVGGTVPGTFNTIANSFEAGVRVDGNFTRGNRILGNSIFGNAELGIDLNGGIEDASGRTLNDIRDPDAGPNKLQNFPVLTSARKISGGTTIVSGSLDSIPRREFIVRLFSNPLGEDEGKTFLGQKKVTTNRRGKAAFTFETTRLLATENRITATATDPGGNTSEFSDPVLAQGD